MKSLWLILLLVSLAAVPAFSQAAVIHKDTGLCGMLGSDANGNRIGGGIGNIQLEVQNNNKLMLTCKGSGIENDSGQGQHFTGFPCGIVAPDGTFVITNDSSATVSADGKASLTCTAPPA